MVAPDDQRFLIASSGAGPSVVDGGSTEAPTTVLVNNFFEELERLVPE